MVTLSFILHVQYNIMCMIFLNDWSYVSVACVYSLYNKNFLIFHYLYNLKLYFQVQGIK
jgi:hypothetical protein